MDCGVVYSQYDDFPVYTLKWCVCRWRSSVSGRGGCCQSRHCKKLYTKPLIITMIDILGQWGWGYPRVVLGEASYRHCTWIIHVRINSLGTLICYICISNAMKAEVSPETPQVPTGLTSSSPRRQFYLPCHFLSPDDPGNFQKYIKEDVLWTVNLSSD